jgi:hypothetical protein
MYGRRYRWVVLVLAAVLAAALGLGLGWVLAQDPLASVREWVHL